MWHDVLPLSGSDVFVAKSPPEPWAQTSSATMVANGLRQETIRALDRCIAKFTTALKSPTSCALLSPVRWVRLQDQWLLRLQLNIVDVMSSF
jgi:hypothetical protein